MNPHKLRAIVEFVRREGWSMVGDGSSVGDIEGMFAWLGLGQLLTSREQLVVRR